MCMNDDMTFDLVSDRAPFGVLIIECQRLDERVS